ncbi:hypothetical protein ACLB2K_040510 [Fragaria x ananassa]
MASTKVQRIMTQPIKARIQIWLFEQKDVRIEGRIIGFDEYMNLVLDDAEEVSIKKNTRKTLGRILLKGDNITLMMNTRILSPLTVFLMDTVSTCYVPSRERVAGRNEVEFLRGFHSVPAQVTASRGRDWGGPVFDSPMLNPRLIGDCREVASQSALDWGLRLMWRVSPRLIGDCREVASQSALDWGLRLMWRVSLRLIGDCRKVASQSALDWGPWLHGEAVRA